MSLSNPVVDSESVPKTDYLSQFGSTERAFDFRYTDARYTLVYPENSKSENYSFNFSTQFGGVVTDLTSMILAFKASITKKDGGTLRKLGYHFSPTTSLIHLSFF